MTALLLVIMLVVGSLLYPNFTSGQAIFDLLGKNVFLIPLAIGMTFVILSGGIDLSVGAVMALGSVIAASLLQAGWSAVAGDPDRAAGRPPAWAWWSGIMISRFEIQPFIATLAAMFLARGLCLVITDRSIAIDDSFFQSMNLAHINLWEQETVNLRGAGPDHRRLHHAVGADRAGRAGGGVRGAALQPVRPDRLRGRRQRAVVAADGPAGRPDQGQRLRDQRVLRRRSPGCCSPSTPRPATRWPASATSSTRSPRW